MSFLFWLLEGIEYSGLHYLTRSRFSGMLSWCYGFDLDRFVVRELLLRWIKIITVISLACWISPESFVYYTVLTRAMTLVVVGLSAWFWCKSKHVQTKCSCSIASSRRARNCAVVAMKILLRSSWCAFYICFSVFVDKIISRIYQGHWIIAS